MFKTSTQALEGRFSTLGSTMRTTKVIHEAVWDTYAANSSRSNWTDLETAILDDLCTELVKSECIEAFHKGLLAAVKAVASRWSTSESYFLEALTLHNDHHALLEDFF
jgi:hypothetical protein